MSLTTSDNAVPLAVIVVELITIVAEPVIVGLLVDPVTAGWLPTHALVPTLTHAPSEFL